MARWICQSKSDDINEITRVSGTSEIEIQQLKLKLWAGRRLEKLSSELGKWSESGEAP